jgi:hypothetical protein
MNRIEQRLRVAPNPLPQRARYERNSCSGRHSPRDVFLHSLGPGDALPDAEAVIFSILPILAILSGSCRSIRIACSKVFKTQSLGGVAVTPIAVILSIPPILSCCSAVFAIIALVLGECRQMSEAADDASRLTVARLGPYVFPRPRSINATCTATRGPHGSRCS